MGETFRLFVREMMVASDMRGCVLDGRECRGALSKPLDLHPSWTDAMAMVHSSSLRPSSLGLGEGVAVRPAPRLFRKPGYTFNGALAGTCGAKPFSLVRERTSGFVRGVLSARHLVTSFLFEDLPIFPHLPTPDIEVSRKPRHSLFFESPRAESVVRLEI